MQHTFRVSPIVFNSIKKQIRNLWFHDKNVMIQRGDKILFFEFDLEKNAHTGKTFNGFVWWVNDSVTTYQGKTGFFITFSKVQPYD